VGDPTGQYPYALESAIGFDYTYHELSRWGEDGGSNVDDQDYKDEHYLFNCGDEDLISLTNTQQIMLCRAIRRAKQHMVLMEEVKKCAEKNKSS
jgi:hypothetical protein